MLLSVNISYGSGIILKALLSFVNNSKGLMSCIIIWSHKEYFSWISARARRSKLQHHCLIKMWDLWAEASQTPGARWSPCAFREPQIGSLACGLQGHQTCDPNTNLQRPQKGSNRACQGRLNVFITKEKHAARLTNDMFAKWCKNTFWTFQRGESVINYERVWQALSSPAVEL